MCYKCYNIYYHNHNHNNKVTTILINITIINYDSKNYYNIYCNFYWNCFCIRRCTARINFMNYIERYSFLRRKKKLSFGGMTSGAI